MDDLDQRIATYFRTRTKGQQGVIADYILVPEKHHAISLCNNDYLNLVNNKDTLTQQIVDLQESTGRGIIMSSMFLNSEDPQYALERELRDWFGKDCFLAQSGYAANVGLMQAICKPGTHIYADRLLHMSFYDPVATRNAVLHINRHNDTGHLEANIQKHGPGIILVESLYSVTGDYCPLAEIVRIKKKYNCVLVVDESHSLGACHAKGYTHMEGLNEDVDYVTASLAKAYATRAGIVFASNARFVKENAYTYIFSSGLMRNDIVRIHAIWNIIKGANDRRQALARASARFRSEISQVSSVLGVEGNLPSAIVSIRMKDEDDMAHMHRHLSHCGVIASPFAFPATPAKSPVIRFTVHSDITKPDITHVKNVIAAYYGTSTGSDRGQGLQRSRL